MGADDSNSGFQDPATILNHAANAAWQPGLFRYRVAYDSTTFALRGALQYSEVTTIFYLHES
jgi:hypothetical protein